MKKIEIIGRWLKEGSKILILGCGNGEILKELQREKKVKGFGIDINESKVFEAISDGLSVLQGDINTDLFDWPGKSFDFVIAHDIVQIMIKPDVIIKQMIELGDKVIISFPNFAYFLIRMNILFLGRMPKTKILPYEWYDTPNIHLFTIKDFKEFCKKENLDIIEEFYTGLGKKTRSKFMRPNLLAEFAYFLISNKKQIRNSTASLLSIPY
jgi:methionine biosynthesis protein MetW